MEGKQYLPLWIVKICKEYKSVMEGKDIDLKLKFSIDHIYETKLRHQHSVEAILSVFERNSETIQESLKTSNEAPTTGLVEYPLCKDEPAHAVQMFLGELLTRFSMRQYIFFVRLANGSRCGPYHLKRIEAEVNPRFITTKECNGCHKKDVSLFRCSKCKKAAYCGSECQTKDYKEFHNYYCVYLCTEEDEKTSIK